MSLDLVGFLLGSVVHPDDRLAQRVPLSIQHNERLALGADGDRSDRSRLDPGLLQPPGK